MLTSVNNGKSQEGKGNNMNLLTVQNVRGYEENGVVYANLEDIARGLGLTQHKNEIEYVRYEMVNRYLSEYGFSHEYGKDDFIPENQIYLLAMRANNETAVKFQMLLANEVIPSIRKHGMYATEVTVEKMLNDPDFAIDLLTRLKEERKARIEAEQTNAILMHVNKTYTSTEIAKELNMKSAMALNKALADKKVQYKQNDTWVLYSKYADLGYTEIKQKVLDSGRTVYDRHWTQRGRKFILELFGVEVTE